MVENEEFHETKVKNFQITVYCVIDIVFCLPALLMLVKRINMSKQKKKKKKKQTNKQTKTSNQPTGHVMRISDFLFLVLMDRGKSEIGEK